MKNKNLVAGFLFLFGSFLIFGSTVIHVGAANSTQVKVHTLKITKTYQDIIASSVPGEDGRFRDVDLGFSLPAGGEMLSTIVQETENFNLDPAYTVGLVGAGGSDFSSGNLGNSTVIHNADGENGRFRVYSFSESFPVHVLMHSGDLQSDLVNLTQGVVSFYFSWIEH
jgi:hypothetical protein